MHDYGSHALGVYCVLSHASKTVHLTSYGIVFENRYTIQPYETPINVPYVYTYVKI